MNSILVVVVLLAVASTTAAKSNYGATVYQQRIFEQEINSTINGLVDRLKEHDPVHIDHRERTILGHTYILDNVNAEGFSNIYASHIKLSGLTTWTFEITLEAPHASASVERWQIEGDVIYGDGAASAEINGLKLSVSAKINILSISVSDVKVTPSIDNALVSITGIKNDEQLSQEITDKINKFLNETLNNGDWHDQVNEIIQNIIDKILDWILG